MPSHSSCFELISVTNQPMLWTAWLAKGTDSNQAMLIFPHFHAFLIYRVQARVLIYFPGENQFHSSDVFYITWRQLSLHVVFLPPYQLQWFFNPQTKISWSIKFCCIIFQKTFHRGKHVANLSSCHKIWDHPNFSWTCENSNLIRHTSLKVVWLQLTLHGFHDFSLWCSWLVAKPP